MLRLLSLARPFRNRLRDVSDVYDSDEEIDLRRLPSSALRLDVFFPDRSGRSNDSVGERDRLVDIVDIELEEPDDIDLDRFLDPFGALSSSACGLRPRLCSFSGRGSLGFLLLN